MAEMTKDRDVQHGHSQEYFDKVDEKVKNPSNKVKKTVHIIAHSHDDLGWLKTVDQYYEGTKEWFREAGVSFIIDGYVQELLRDPSKKFSQVEIGFFSMWWDEQNDDRKADFRMLVEQGRIEFLSAGWSMHDEATVHYEDLINNMLIGHNFL